jgi:hypothetical protein
MGKVIDHRRRWVLPDYGKVMLVLFPLWLLVVVQVYFLRRMAGAPVSMARIVLENLTLYFAMLVLVPLVLWAARKCPMDQGAWKQNLLKHAGILGIVGALDYLLERSMFLLVRPGYAMAPSLIRSRLTLQSDSLDGLAATLCLVGPFYILIVVSHYAFNYHHDIQERALQSAQLEAQYSQSRLQTLKSQLQPHFLFNALNAIQSHIPMEAETAKRMVLLLSSFLRRSLQEIGLQKVKLKQEVEFVNLYLEIQQMRFSNRLTFLWELDDAVLEHEVPHLILQPLVENAIKHGLEPKVGPGTVWIKASRTSAYLCLSVMDDGLGLRSRGRAAHGSGVGLSNTRKRLQHLYRDAAIFEYGARAGGGFQVLIQLPLEASDRFRSGPPVISTEVP